MLGTKKTRAGVENACGAQKFSAWDARKSERERTLQQILDPVTGSTNATFQAPYRAGKKSYANSKPYSANLIIVFLEMTLSISRVMVMRFLFFLLIRICTRGKYIGHQLPIISGRVIIRFVLCVSRNLINTIPKRVLIKIIILFVFRILESS